MARRIVNRMEKRAEYEAYERRQDEDEETEEEEKEEDDEAEEEAEGDEDEEAAADEGAEGEEEEKVVVKKRKPVKAPKPPKAPKARSRARAPKVPPRMKVVWGVFNNSNQRVATFDYPKRNEADAHAAKLRNDKNQTFFVQPVKEPIEEKKEKEKE